MKYQILNRGQSLFELVVAIGISALVIVVLVSLVSNALQNAAFSKNESLAGTYAQQATEWLRGQRDSDTATFEQNVSNSINTVVCFNILDWTGSVGGCDSGDTIQDKSRAPTPFIRQIGFSYQDVDVGGVTKTIVETDVTVTWTDSKGLHEVTNATYFADWRQR